jgi:multiple sugar transport system permease protein
LSWLTFGAFEPRRLARQHLDRAAVDHGDVDLAGRWVSHGDLACRALQTISPTLYEAADIEGASKWQTFRYVTWPGLRNTAVLILIVITMQGFALFRADRRDDRRRAARLDPGAGLPGRRTRL